jgi:hypothetical protein
VIPVLVAFNWNRFKPKEGVGHASRFAEVSLLKWILAALYPWQSNSAATTLLGCALPITRQTPNFTAVDLE